MKDLTKGTPAKVIILFALPLMIGNIAQQLYNITDSKIVSLLLDGDALAAVGSTAPISNLLMGFLNGLTQGFAIITARYFGAGDRKSLRRNVAGTIILTVVFLTILTVIGIITARPMLRLLETPDEIMDKADIYLKIIIYGIGFTAVYNMCANILRAVGDSKRPLYCLFISIAINLILDIVFIKDYQMGIAGAAVATIIAQCVCAFSCLIILIVKARDLLPHRDEWRISGKEYKDLISFGFAMGFMGCIVNIGTIILQKGINKLGTVVLTAHIAARRVLDIMMIMVYTIGFSMTTYVSQNFGAGRIDRIKKGVRQATLIDSAITTVLIAFCFLFDEKLVGFIASSNDPEILENGKMYLRIGVVFFYTLGPLFILRCSLQGMGSRFAPLLTSTMECGIKILSLLFLVPVLGYLGVALTEPISWTVMTIALLIGYIVVIRKYKDII